MARDSSARWFDDEGTAVRLDRGFPLPSHEFQLTWDGRTLTSLMVIPTLQKETLNPPYSELRVLFSDVVQTCGFLIVAGSSLRDAHLTSVIATRLQDEEAVVLVVDPNIPAGIGGLVRRDLVVHVAGDFHDFLSVAADELPALAREIASSPDITAKCGQLRTFAETSQTRIQSLADLTEDAGRAVHTLAHGSPSDKIGAVATLRGNSSTVVVDSIISALSDEDPDVRAAAASVASQLDDSRVVSLLESNVETSQDTSQKMEAALALKRMTVPEAASAVERLKRPESGTDPVVRRILS